MPAPPYRRLTTFALVLGIVALAASDTTGAEQRPIKKLSIDPNAEKIEMFDGIEKGAIDVKLVPKNSLKGNMLVTNKTDKPLTVKLPDAFVGVQVLKQTNFFGSNQGQQNGLGSGNSGGGGAGQAVGGGGGNQQSNNPGIFSVPPEKTMLVPYNSVCLEHGKAEPRVRMNYRPIPVEKFNNDVVLYALLKLVASERLDPKTAQAAAWHLSDDMSWKKLAAKQVKHLGGRRPTRYFTSKQIQAAKNLIDRSKTIAAHDKTTKPVTVAKSSTRKRSATRNSRKN